MIRLPQPELFANLHLQTDHIVRQVFSAVMMQVPFPRGETRACKKRF